MIAPLLSVVAAASMVLALGLYCRRHGVRIRPRRVWSVLFPISASVSLLICVATAALWVRSYIAVDWFSYRVETEYRLVTANGLLEFGLWQRSSNWAMEYRGWHHEVYPPVKDYPMFNWKPSPLTSWNRLGFGARSTTVDWGYAALHEDAFTVPAWLIALVSGLMPTLWLRRIASHRLRKRRLHFNRCPNCAYDLRATPVRCPECGAIPAEAKP